MFKFCKIKFSKKCFKNFAKTVAFFVFVWYNGEQINRNEFLVTTGELKMQAQKLSLINFRNFGELDMEFESGLTVISGQNGAGKTNILEALYMCSIGRSPRTRQDGLLIKKGKSVGQASVVYKKGGTTRSVGVSINTNKAKTVILDGVPSAKVSEIVGNFACVYFSPDEVDIVRGGPQYRRRFMDIINCQINSNYMSDLKNLQHCIKQRNALLRGIKLDAEYDKSLEPWDEQIVNYSVRIMSRRYGFLKNLQKLVDSIMRILTDNEESLKITYRSFCDRLDQINIKSLGDEYRQKVRQNYTKDVLLHTSSIGPHLDDFDIKLVYIKNNDKKDGGLDAEEYEYISLRNEGSLGQQRTATLALKIAEVFIYHKYYGEKPVLLLDDVLSELDFERRRKLMEYCRHFDTIVTCTEWSYENPVPDTWYRVNDAKVEKMPIISERFTYAGELNARALEFAKKINQMADGYFEQEIWLQPVCNKVLEQDCPREEKQNINFDSEEVNKLLDMCENPQDEYDIWNDEGQKAKRTGA